MRRQGNHIVTALSAATAWSFDRPGVRVGVRLVSRMAYRRFLSTKRSGNGPMRKPD